MIIACFLDARYKKENWKEYTNNELVNFWKDVSIHGRKKMSVNVYAHNMGYDLLVTNGIKTLCEQGFKVESWFESGLTYILTMRKKDEAGTVVKTINLISTTNFFPVSLEKLALSVGMEKFSFDFDKGTIEDAKVYCRQDVEIIKKAVESFIAFVRDENLGCLAKTTAGQAFNAYRHRFMTSPIFLHDLEHVFDLERKSYYGGRTECFKIGNFDGVFYGLDINSMYPYVMRDNPYPAKIVSYRKNNNLEDLKYFLRKGYLVCARLTVETEKPVLPCTLSDSLIFPIGTFETVLCTPEVRLALERGLIREVKEVSIYEGQRLFTEYVNYFYSKRMDARKSGDTTMDMFYKNLLNSLYGKFGQKSPSWEKIGEVDINKVEVVDVYDTDKDERYTLKTFGGGIWKSLEEGESYNSFCAIAGHVTSYARVLLLEYMEKAGTENVYYTDTDSLFVSETGYQNLETVIDNQKLGMLKKEKTGNNLKIYAPKDYIFAGETKRKGVKKGSVVVEDTEKPVFEADVWPRLNSFLRQGKIGGYQTEKRLKKLQREYNKGWVEENGNVHPFNIKNIYDVNYLKPFEESYSFQLLDEYQEKKIEKIYRKNMEVDLNLFYEKEKENLSAEDKKKLKRTILLLGGVKDTDYENIPRCLRRKNGFGLDELATELKSYGFDFEDGNDLYNKIK